jgi:hypothetical protein
MVGKWRSEKIQISETTIQAQVNKVWMELLKTDFELSNGCLRTSENKHNIVYKDAAWSMKWRNV